MDIAQSIISRILDKGLADSTWREQFPEAYDGLIEYRQDLEESVNEGLRGSSILKKLGVKVKIMVVIPHYWAKGGTIDEAWRNVRDIAGGTLREHKKDKHIIYVCFDKEDGSISTYLDDLGMNVSYPSGFPPIVIHKKD